MEDRWWISMSTLLNLYPTLNWTVALMPVGCHCDFSNRWLASGTHVNQITPCFYILLQYWCSSHVDFYHFSFFMFLWAACFFSTYMSIWLKIPNSSNDMQKCIMNFGLIFHEDGHSVWANFSVGLLILDFDILRFH